MSKNDYAIEMIDIVKDFPGIRANDHINLRVKKGEIHAIAGENGAGKSTLMSILFGIYQPTEGYIKVNEKKINIKNPTMASNLGIGMVHQHFKLVGVFDAIDNIMLGYEIKEKSTLDSILKLYQLRVTYIEKWFQLSNQQLLKSSNENKEFYKLYDRLKHFYFNKLNLETKQIKQQMKWMKSNRFKKNVLNTDLIIWNTAINLFNLFLINPLNRFAKFKLKLFKPCLLRGTKPLKQPNLDIFHQKLIKIKEKIDAVQISIENTDASSEKYSRLRAAKKMFVIEQKYINSLTKLSIWKTKNETVDFINKDKIAKDIMAISDKYNLKINTKIKVDAMTVGMQQRVEILKMLYRENEILIFDEPTAVLTHQEIQEFLKTLLHFKELGKTIIIITHKLNEIKQIADHCTIIRKGKYIDCVDVKLTTTDCIAEMMVGSKVEHNTIHENAIEKKPILSLHSVSYQLKNKMYKLKDIDLDIKQGEILGIAGVEGNGQLELSEIIAGLIKPTKGNINYYHRLIFSDYFKLVKHFKNCGKVLEIKIFIKKNKIKNKFVGLKAGIFNLDYVTLKNNWWKYFWGMVWGARIECNDFEIMNNLNIQQHYDAGISHIPEDRHKYGLVLDMNILENVITADFRKRQFSQYGFLKFNNAVKYANFIINKYDVRCSNGYKTMVRQMSGGNQQKLILGRELEKKPKVIIAAQPCRGLDLGAIENIHKSLIAERDAGNAVILLSYELDEIIDISDRVGVMYDGQIMDVLNRDSISKERIGLLMAGVKMNKQVRPFRFWLKLTSTHLGV